VEAGPPGTGYRLRKLIHKHRTAVTLACGFILTVAVAAALCAWQAVRATQAKQQALAERDRAEEARVAEAQAADRERQARAKAEANLNLARKAVDRGFTRVSQLPELKGLALEGLRQDLLREAKEFYELFVQQDPGEPHLQAERGRAYLQLADITEDLGDRSKAVDYAQQAERMFALLCKDHAAVGEYQDGLARALTSQGRNFRELESPPFPQAVKVLQHSLELRQELVATNPGEPQYRFQLALTFNQLGPLYIDGLHKLSAGVAALENARALCEQLRTEDPEEPQYVSELAQTFNNLRTMGDYSATRDQAIADGERAAALLEQLVHDYPRVADYQARLTIYLSNIAGQYLNSAHPERALAACAKALPIAEQLARAHPDVPAYRHRVTFVQVMHAGALAMSGEFRQAAAELESLQADVSARTSGWSVLGMTIFNSACTYCACAIAARKSSAVPSIEGQKLADQYLDRALAALGKAKTMRVFESAQGINLLKTDNSLDPLRPRDDFRKFLAQVEAEARQHK